MLNDRHVKEEFHALRWYRGQPVWEKKVDSTRMQTGERIVRSVGMFPAEDGNRPDGRIEIEIDPLHLKSDQVKECLKHMNRPEIEEWRRIDPRKGSYVAQYMNAIRWYLRQEKEADDSE